MYNSVFITDIVSNVINVGHQPVITHTQMMKRMTQKALRIEIVLIEIIPEMLADIALRKYQKLSQEPVPDHAQELGIGVVEAILEIDIIMIVSMIEIRIDILVNAVAIDIIVIADDIPVQIAVTQIHIAVDIVPRVHGIIIVIAINVHHLPKHPPPHVVNWWIIEKTLMNILLYFIIF